jgi:predicted CoA-binding protein
MIKFLDIYLRRRKMDQMIQDFISSQNIAVVGASRLGNKFGNMANNELKRRGYKTLLVHPEAREIDGQECHSNLASVKDQAEVVFICLPADQAETVLQEAADVGLKKIWLQQGAESTELVDFGKSLDLNMITGKCVLMYAEPVQSFHKVHQVIAKLFGKY